MTDADRALMDFKGSVDQMTGFVDGYAVGFQDGRRHQFWKMAILTLPLLACVVMIAWWGL